MKIFSECMLALGVFALFFIVGVGIGKVVNASVDSRSEECEIWTKRPTYDLEGNITHYTVFEWCDGKLFKYKVEVIER